MARIPEAKEMPQVEESASVKAVTRVPAAARLNRLPVTSLHRRIMLVLSFVFFFDHADINTLSFAAPAIMKFWNVKVTTIALFNSATFTGMFLGSVFGGMISDRIGRKRAMIGNAVFYAGFSLLNAFAWDPVSLFVTRMLTGVGISATTVVGIAYISEIYPARVRGSFQGWVMTFGLAGVPCTALVARMVVPLAPLGWRLVFVWGSIGLLFPLFARALEESPRWYENHGRFDEADAVLDRIEARVRAESGELPPVDGNVMPEKAHRKTTDLFGRACLPRTATLVCTWICLTMGFFGFASWVPTLLVAHGFSLVHSLTFSLAMTIAAIPGAGLAGLFSDRFDRKWSITVIALLIAICGAFYGMTFKISFIIFFGFLVEMFMHTSMPLTYSYTAESFPSGIRNSGTGVAYGAGRLANIVGPLIIAFIYNHYGYKSVFGYISALWIMVALIVSVFGVRSRTLVERAL
jgi:MFS transporter, putative metabolite:H+ symporter